MIVVKLMGGHSNQMFQYAVGRQLALKHNTKLVLDCSWFKSYEKVDTPRVYELGTYKIEAMKFTSPLLSKVIQKSGLIKKYTEPNYHYDSHINNLGPSV